MYFNEETTALNVSTGLWRPGSSRVVPGKSVFLLLLKDDECMFWDCLEGSLSLSCLVKATFLFTILYIMTSLASVLLSPRLPVTCHQHQMFWCLLVTSLVALHWTILSRLISALLKDSRQKQLHTQVILTTSELLHVLPVKNVPLGIVSSVTF